MKPGYWFVSILATIAVGISLLLFVPDRLVWFWEIHRGSLLVEEVEAFKQKRGRLPASLSEITVSDELQDRFFYEKCDERRFILWFGTSLGESMTYDSAKGSWDALNGACQ